MNKLLLSAALLASTVAFPAMAQVSSSTSAAVDLLCLSAAVNTRENAIIDARTTFNASIIASITARRDALKAALLITNAQDRQVAVNAAWKAYMDSTAKARLTYQTSVRAAWKTYGTARVSCHADAKTDASVPSMKNKDDDDRQSDKTGKKHDINAAASAVAKLRARGLGVGLGADSNARVDLSF